MRNIYGKKILNKIIALLSVQYYSYNMVILVGDYIIIIIISVFIIDWYIYIYFFFFPIYWNEQNP